ncbi:MAG: enoyl-CoA hydratase/isomerase family protein [Kofleriaceae bacterium]
MSSSPAARYARRADDAVGVLTLDRPANRNSMTPELLDAFVEALAAARADDGLRCLVITGTGTSFSAGADFRSVIQRGDDGATPAARSYAMYEPFLGVLDVEVPVIAACNGHAVGGGFGLALVCDLRVGARGARYGANFARLGLHPGMAITYTLPRLIGAARAAELLYTGRLLDGEAAHQLGVLEHVVDAAAVLPTACALAAEIAAAAPLAVRATKATLSRGVAEAARAAARAEAADQAATLTTIDAGEGIAALLAKRAPVFIGR